MKIIMIITAGIVIYTYLIYPIMLISISNFRKNKKISRADYNPFISLIIPVYNGGSLIEKKIENTHALLYPSDKLEIIIVSDGADDETNCILQSQRDITTVLLEDRSGKEAAVRAGLEKSHGDLICLSDIGTMINPEGLQNMVVHFKNKNIGAVSSIDKTDFGSYSLETLHVDFVNKIRVLEADISSSTGVSGSFFMTRKHLLENIPLDCCSDLAIALECESNRYRAIVEPLAHGKYKNSTNADIELSRKIRTAAQGMKTLMTYRALLNPFSYGLFSLQLISSKLLKWISPISLTILISLLVIYFASGMAINQLIIFYSLLTLAILIPATRKIILDNVRLLAAYNIAPIVSVYFFIQDKDLKVWHPTKRY